MQDKTKSEKDYFLMSIFGRKESHGTKNLSRDKVGWGDEQRQVGETKYEDGDQKGDVKRRAGEKLVGR